VTYLARVRNHLLLPLDSPENVPSQLQVNHTTTRFDKVLFLNDILFQPKDALHLLFSTNRGKYQAACAIDFVKGAFLYDSFAIRDADGYEISWPFYPWFTTKGSGKSRRDVLAEKDAVRVSSCWSGMAAYEATPFLRREVLEDEQSQLPESQIIDSSLPRSFVPNLPVYVPLRFRSQPDLIWEASECCLINADLLVRYPSFEPQMYLNPYIRVAYDRKTWTLQPWIQRIERLFTPAQWIISKTGFQFPHNPRRLELAGKTSIQERWMYDRPELNGEIFGRNATITEADFEPDGSMLSGRFVETPQIALPGGYCGIKKLFVIVPDLELANSARGSNWEDKRLKFSWSGRL
jgi:hypothetical protein